MADVINTVAATPDGPIWTEMQLRAIDTRDKTLLVSAAAGSGKTATLTERIIRSLTDSKNPINIDDMLIVTFTRLAAGELREKIAKAIRKELERRPGDAHLEKQIHTLPSAKICTIDSFCTDILRANADRVGISPNFRIPDEAECALLGENILNGMFSAIYAGELDEVATAAELSSLADCLTDTSRDSDLAVIIAAIRATIVTTLKGADSILELIGEYDPEKFTRVEATRFGEYIMTRLSEAVAHYEKNLSSALREVVAADAKKHAKIINMLEDDLKFVRSLGRAKSYTEARDIILARKHPKAANNADPTLPMTTKLHGALGTDISALAKKFFAHTEEDWRTAYAGLYRELHTLYRLIKYYEDALRKEKTRRNMCEFADIERYTYELLWRDGKRTDVAIAQSRLYAQIYIDEYQDVNNLQDAIFEAISTPTNRFMVGDIKQSIYTFRSANPDIFARMKEKYPEITVAGDSDCAAVFMSDNFRCDRGVIDFVNSLFDRIFGIVGKSIGYVPNDRLVCSKYKYTPEPPYRAPELCLIDSSAIKKKNKDNPDFEDGMISPYAVAQKIRELLDDEKEVKNDGKRITPGDIAIIMRSAKSKIGFYKQALEELGIPVAVPDTAKFFLSPEALLALCLLNSIDNPHRDVYLAGLMLSPLYSFTEDELAIIRRAGGDTLYTSLKIFIKENPSFEKGKSFLEKLNHYRLISEGMPTDALMLRLYHETGLLALAAKNGAKDRLLRLYEYARTFEASSFKGLYNFISYLNSITERKNSLDKREAPKDPSAVNIVTGHGSKGLEYPIVFYVGCGDPSGNNEGAARFDYAEDFGIGMYLRTPSGLALVRNATRAIISDYSKRKEFEEEARILYVTLTRARERLYIVANAGKKLDDFNKDIAFAKEYLDSYSIYSHTNILRLMLASAPIKACSVEDFLKKVPKKISLSDDMTTKVDNPDTTITPESPEANKPKTPEKLDTGGELGFVSPTSDTAGVMRVPEPYRKGELKTLLTTRFNYAYPQIHLTRLPEKVSVSVLYPELLDGTDVGVVMLPEGEGDSPIKAEEPTEATVAEPVTLDTIMEFDERSELERVTAAEAEGSPSSKAKKEGLRFPGFGILPEFIAGEDLDSSTKRGIATHLLFQFCDLDRLAREGAAAELSHLVDEKFISPTDAKRVRLNEVDMFVGSRLLSEMRAAKKLYREFRFNVRLPAEDFVTSPKAKELYRGEFILVQGVIDCLYLDEKGDYHLVDYKTDRLTRAELADLKLARKKMVKEHATQLTYYGKAVELIFGKPPVSRDVYSLHLGDTLSVM